MVGGGGVKKVRSPLLVYIYKGILAVSDSGVGKRTAFMTLGRGGKGGRQEGATANVLYWGFQTVAC